MRINIFILGALGSFVGFTTAAPAAPRGHESDYAGPCNDDSDCRGDILICEDTGLQQRHCVVGDRWPYMSRDLSSGTGEPENEPADLEARRMEVLTRCTSDDECEGNACPRLPGEPRLTTSAGSVGHSTICLMITGTTKWAYMGQRGT